MDYRKDARRFLQQQREGPEDLEAMMDEIEQIRREQLAEDLEAMMDEIEQIRREQLAEERKALRDLRVWRLTAIVDRRPVCPCCREEMVRAHYQNEEGDWFVCWLCECEPDPEIIRGLEEEPCESDRE